MVEHVSPTLDPQKVPSASPVVQSQDRSADTNRNFVFDSLARESALQDEETASPWKAALTGLLWVGYLIAVAVAVVLVWSAAKELLL